MSQGGGAVPNQINMVATGTVVEGTLRADSDVRVSGRIVGTVMVTGRVVVASEGVVEGELVASSADVGGSVEGELRIEERLVLRSSARIEGAIQTARLIVEEGAVFNGECQMGQAGQLRKPANASRSETPRPLPEARRPDAVRPAEGARAPGEGGEAAKARTL